MLTPEQAQDLVDWAGSKDGAARAVGISPSTIRYWLDPEPARNRVRRYHRANREAETEKMRERYHNLSGLKYSELLLRHRRYKALQRRAERERRRRRGALQDEG